MSMPDDDCSKCGKQYVSPALSVKKSGDKPKGMWRCRACGTVCDGSLLYDDPASTAVKWTCSDLFCGGTCDPVVVQPSQPQPNKILVRAFDFSGT